MTPTELPTEELVNEYFAADHRLHVGDGTAAARLSDMTGMMGELEARGVCPRDLRAPEWYTAATDDRRGFY